MAGKNQTTSKSEFDPQLKAALMSVFQSGQGVAQTPFQPYQFAQVAPFSPFELEGMNMTAQTARGGVGQGAIQNAIGSAYGASRYSPQNIGRAPRGPVRPMFGGYGGQFGGQFNKPSFPSYLPPQPPGMQAGLQGVQAERLRDTRLAPYQNPYESQVVGTALGDIERSRQMMQQQNAARAQAAGAFGGSRDAIVRSETNRAALEQAANTASQLRAQGFESSARRAESDVGRNLQSQQMNQQAALAAAQANQQAGLQGAQTRLAGAGQLAGLGQALRGTQFADAAAMTQMGQQQRQMAQQQMADRYGQFEERREWPFRMFDVLRSGAGILPSPVTQYSKGRGWNIL
jgi:hypothetical protein